jgi:hypothetical protein
MVFWSLHCVTHAPAGKILHHTPKANTPLHLNFRAARHYTQDYTTTVTPCLEYSWLKREPHNLYTVRLHIHFRAPDDGQWWPETCRAFLAINIVKLSHLVGHIYHIYMRRISLYFRKSQEASYRVNRPTTIWVKPDVKTWTNNVLYV